MLLNVCLDVNISVLYVLYLSQTYPSRKPLFKGQGPVNLTFKQLAAMKPLHEYHQVGQH